LEPNSLRIYLAGRVCIEADERLIDQHAFPSQQGRLAFAYLVSERGRPVTRTELAEALWPKELPTSWDASLSAVISKLRSLLGTIGLTDSSTVTGATGCYEIRLPRCTWVDLEAAADSIHEAEAALKAGDAARAYGPSAVAHHIARRPFLPGEEGAWVEHRRDKLRSILIRALECRAEVYLWNHEFPLAVEAARDAVALEPFRETCYQLLMRAHSAAGNVAEALWVYEQCRKLIAEELGVHPSRQTRSVYQEVLQAI
jgi:DNA-binding SARP family transcriptional activator